MQDKGKYIRLSVREGSSWTS